MSRCPGSEGWGQGQCSSGVVHSASGAVNCLTSHVLPKSDGQAPWEWVSHLFGGLHRQKVKFGVRGRSDYTGKVLYFDSLHKANLNPLSQHRPGQICNLPSKGFIQRPHTPSPPKISNLPEAEDNDNQVLALQRPFLGWPLGWPSSSLLPTSDLCQL